MYLEELENFKLFCFGNVRDFERFVDLLDVIVVNLKEVGWYEELGSGLLYFSLCKKLIEVMLVYYYWWIYENGCW